MALSVNRVTLLGNLGKDPEIRSTKAGKQVANMSVATAESWKDSNGEWKEKTSWHTVVVFNEHLAKTAERMRKGARVYLEGALQTRKWQDQNGQDRYSTEVVLQGYDAKLIALDRVERKEEDGGTFSAPAPARRAPMPQAKPVEDFGDEIPF